MAGHDPTIALSRDEMVALVDRMRSRAESVLNLMPSVASDMMTAARLIIVLMRKADIGEGDRITLDNG